MRCADRDFQGCATVNYCDADVPYTRILEWQHYGHRSRPGKSIITREYAFDYVPGKNEPIYPVESDVNRSLYERYKRRIPEGMWVGGRLGSYRYLDMDQTIGQAMGMCEKIFTAESQSKRSNAEKSFGREEQKIKSFQRGDAEIKCGVRGETLLSKEQGLGGASG